MKPTEEQMNHIRAAAKSYGVAYVLMTEAIDRIDTGDMHVRKAGMYKYRLKQLAKRVQAAYDAFITEFQPLVAEGDGKLILSDCEKLKDGVDKLVNG